MSTKGARDLRPVLHYTPPKAWINDPNGLVWDGGAYHLFAQHYPDATRHGPMHWLHATSEDCIRWKQLGIALAPDELGYIFSGSAVVDKGNTSGLGAARDPMIAMFTHHKDTESQSIAYSNDGLNFTKYAGNPVIGNPGIRDFRDPRAFRYGDGWRAAVAAGGEVRFYESSNLIDWRATGTFGKTENRLGTVFECPDVFPVTAPDGGVTWVLSASMVQAFELGGSRTQYFLGVFDGKTFKRTFQTEEPLLLDFGYDNYASVTFSGVSPPRMMGWGNCWTYADKVPTNEYCGCMTLARDIKLIDTPRGPRLASAPVLPAPARTRAITDGDGLPCETFVLDVDADGAFEVQLANRDGERFIAGCDGGAFYTDRSSSGQMDFDPYFNSPLYQKTRCERFLSGPVKMRLVFDRSIAEIFADCGAYANTTQAFPASPYDTLILNGARAAISEFDI